ncbi:hypothetical protein HYDPIDRAFT_32656 [Hydnomerulius pinastri MD-312]|uniref:Ubiquitin-like protease family profile domain-containing protein n=1 Tax=Hydnomerulius pinastri MD-312 TaxID=994086 RepID=A0A0C9W9G6_9AGAM|nr:hypothetical protein HYDPIDRAFT_32656 [Hydnomerulius pinastri MD-312]
MGDIIDLTTSKPFISAEWIGKGKKYDTNILPSFVVDARFATTALPAAQQSWIPSPSLSVSQILTLSLPAPSSTIVTVTAKRWFSEDRPDEDFTYLSSRPIPPNDVIKELEGAFGQAWLNGAQSMIDPRFNDGRDRLPLWVLTFWKEMNTVIRAQSTWRASEVWLSAESRTTESTQVMAKARELLSVLPWKADVGYGTTTLVFAQLLGTQWLSDDVMDQMMDNLASQVCSVASTAKALVGSSKLAMVLELVAPSWDFSAKNARILSQYEVQITGFGYRWLYFPAHVHGNHWIAVMVDFHEKTIRYGDSLEGSSPPPKTLVQMLKRWLDARFGGQFRLLNEQMAHGMQTDTFSCGIVTANTIAHAIFGEALWQPSSRSMARASWFIINAREYLQKDQLRQLEPGYGAMGLASVDVLGNSEVLEFIAKNNTPPQSAQVEVLATDVNPPYLDRLPMLPSESHNKLSLSFILDAPCHTTFSRSGLDDDELDTAWDLATDILLDHPPSPQDELEDAISNATLAETSLVGWLKGSWSNNLKRTRSETSVSSQALASETEPPEKRAPQPVKKQARIPMESRTIVLKRTMANGRSLTALGNGLRADFDHP